MSVSSKSPRKVILVALAVGRQGLPDYAHRFSPKVFTQPQLFACLVLQAFLGLDYRGTEAFLSDLPPSLPPLSPGRSTCSVGGVRDLRPKSVVSGSA